MPPPRAEDGTSKFGFAPHQRVEVVKDDMFQGWHGHVRTFSSSLVAVDLDEPPPDHQPNGQWFRPDDLRRAPICVLIEENGCAEYFTLERRPYTGQEVTLKSSDGNISGLYRVATIGEPPEAVRNQFHCKARLERVRPLLRSDTPITVGYYL